jgi:hypothetical protein
MFGRLNLTTQESTAFVLEEGDEDYPGCPEWALVGKVLAPNPLHISTIRSVLCAAWGNPKGLEVNSGGVNLFVAEFARKVDKDRVSEGSPWKVSNHAVLLKDFDPAVQPSDVCFDRIVVWARIMKLPFGLMNDTKGKALASSIGLIERVDVDNKGRAWGDFLRVRVSIKVQEPLLRCVSVFSQKRQATDVYQVMYEKLPLFCFACGMIGHSSLNCKDPGERDMDGFLPYHGTRLYVPKEKKKNSGAKSVQDSFSSNHSEPACGQKGSASNLGKKPGGDVSGEINSPKNPRKPRATRTQPASVAGGKVIVGRPQGAASGTPRVSGQKRKEYRIKIKDTAQPEDISTNLPLVLVEKPSDGSGPLYGIVEGASESDMDSNKKQKTILSSSSHRSTDQAEAAEQPCQTQ